jgi:hypothetical protein
MKVRVSEGIEERVRYVTTYSILLGSGNLLDSESVVEQAAAGETLTNVLLHELNTELRVVDALDLVADTADYEITCIHQHQLIKGNDERQDVLSLFFLAWSTNSRGVEPVSPALENMEAASSRAPPNRLPLVKGPEATNDEMRFLPARVATVVFMAPDTVGSKHDNHLDELGSPRRETYKTHPNK